MTAPKSLLALLILAPNCLADILCVTTWNLEPPTDAGTNEIRLQEAAAALKQLNPDVVLLQQVGSWEMCEELAEALKPAQYTVQVCSTFREPRSGALSPQQVAILSRGNAYFSWSEAWQAQDEAALPGGFVFAAFQVGSRRVGFVSVQAGGASADTGDAAQRAGVAEAQARCVGQLLEEVGWVSNWGTNRVQAFVVGATFNPRAPGWLAARDDTLRLLEAADFGDAFLETPPAGRITVAAEAEQPDATADYILIQPAGCATHAHVLSAPVCEHYPVTCEVDLESAKAASATEGRGELGRTRQTEPASPVPPVVLVTQPSTINFQPAWLAAALAGIVALAASIWILARHRAPPKAQTPALLAASGVMPSSYTVMLGTRSAASAALANASPPPAPHPIIHVEAPGTTHTQAEALRQRALAAEERAERATRVIRAGLIPHLRQWLKQKLLRKLMADRAYLLETQHAAAWKAMGMEERLARVEEQLQSRNAAYEARIEELTRELMLAKEETRELIRARIAEVKAEMEAARARLRAKPEADADGS